jgi:hypothetical protein
VHGAAGRFNASFYINHMLYTFSGGFETALGDYVCKNATLTYTNISELVSSRDLTGTVGKADITLILSNGPTISGPLDNAISTSDLVKGRGIWMQS